MLLDYLSWINAFPDRDQFGEHQQLAFQWMHMANNWNLLSKIIVQISINFGLTGCCQTKPIIEKYYQRMETVFSRIFNVGLFSRLESCVFNCGNWGWNSINISSRQFPSLLPFAASINWEIKYFMGYFVAFSQLTAISLYRSTRCRFSSLGAVMGGSLGWNWYNIIWASWLYCHGRRFGERIDLSATGREIWIENLRKFKQFIFLIHDQVLLDLYDVLIKYRVFFSRALPIWKRVTTLTNSGWC